MLVSAQSANPAAGTWQLNVAKSKYSPGPAPKSSTIKIVANAEGSFTQTVDSVPTTGAPVHYEVTAKKGGKVTVTTKVAISADGKSRTSTQTRTGVDGKAVNNSIVYEKP